MRYERKADGSFVVMVDQGEHVKTTEQTACWYREVELQGGEYPLTPCRIDGTPCAPDERPYYGRGAIPGRVISEFFPSLWGGVAIQSGRPAPQPVDKPWVYHVRPYWYSLEALEAAS